MLQKTLCNFVYIVVCLQDEYPEDHAEGDMCMYHEIYVFVNVEWFISLVPDILQVPKVKYEP